MRRSDLAGLGLFGFISALTFALVCGGLVVLFISFIRPSDQLSIRLLVTLALLPGAAAFVLLMFQLGYHLHASGQKQAGEVERSRLEEWAAFLLDDGPLPRLDRSSASALARLRETTAGAYSEAAAEAYVQFGYLDSDLESLAGRGRQHQWSALSRLGQIREPGALEALQKLLRNCPERMAVEGLRTLARTLDNAGVSEDSAVTEFLTACAARRFTAGEVESALVLTGRQCPGLVRYLLSVGIHVIPALNVAGHLNLLEAVPMIRPYLRSAGPEVRAAALRSVAELQLAPDRSGESILEGLHADQAFVRGQAAKALITLPLEEAAGALVEALGDPDWWVRRNAAASLAAFGPAGRVVLDRARVSHEDPFARESARRAIR